MQPTSAHFQSDLASAEEDRRAATAVLHLVQVDPRRAGELAVGIIDRAGDRRDHATVGPHCTRPTWTQRWSTSAPRCAAPVSRAPPSWPGRPG
jgi:hypothetical protein